MSNILDKLDDYNNLYEFVKSEISSYHFNKWTDDTDERDIKYRTFKIQKTFVQSVRVNFFGIWHQWSLCKRKICYIFIFL